MYWDVLTDAQNISGKTHAHPSTIIVGRGQWVAGGTGGRGDPCEW